LSEKKKAYLTEQKSPKCGETLATEPSDNFTCSDIKCDPLDLQFKS